MIFARANLDGLASRPVGLAVLTALMLFGEGGFSLRAAALVPYGSTNITPGSLFRFYAPLSTHSKTIVARGGNKPVEQGIGGIVLPPRFDPTNRYSVLIVNGTSDGAGTSIPAMKHYTNAAARLGWVVIAADGPDGKPARDDLTWRWAMIVSALMRIHEEWPASRKWPVALEIGRAHV